MKIPANALPDQLDIAEKILLDASDQIRRANKEHGHTLLSFTMIGEMWSTYITHIFTMRGNNKLEPHDVAHMMALVKQARAVYGYSMDNFVDNAGFMSLAGMLTPPPTKETVKPPVPDYVVEDPIPKIKGKMPKVDPLDHPLLKSTRFPME